MILELFKALYRTVAAIFYTTPLLMLISGTVLWIMKLIHMQPLTTMLGPIILFVIGLTMTIALTYQLHQATQKIIAQVKEEENPSKTSLGTLAVCSNPTVNNGQQQMPPSTPVSRSTTDPSHQPPDHTIVTVNPLSATPSITTEEPGTHRKAAHNPQAAVNSSTLPKATPTQLAPSSQKPNPGPKQSKHSSVDLRGYSQKESKHAPKIGENCIFCIKDDLSQLRQVQEHDHAHARLYSSGDNRLYYLPGPVPPVEIGDEKIPVNGILTHCSIYKKTTGYAGGWGDRLVKWGEPLAMLLTRKNDQYLVYGSLNENPGKYSNAKRALLWGWEGGLNGQKPTLDTAVSNMSKTLNPIIKHALSIAEELEKELVLISPFVTIPKRTRRQVFKQKDSNYDINLGILRLINNLYREAIVKAWPKIKGGSITTQVITPSQPCICSTHDPEKGAKAAQLFHDDYYKIAVGRLKALKKEEVVLRKFPTKPGRDNPLHLRRQPLTKSKYFEAMGSARTLASGKEGQEYFVQANCH